MRQRSLRVAEAIKEEVSEILQQDLKDPRLGFVSVVSVEVTRDISQAKIYVSVYGTAEEKKESLSGLNSAKGYIRSEIGKRIRLRHVPEMIFILDDSIEHGAKMNQLFKELEKKNEE